MTRSEASPGALLAIGALARATGLPAETLRTWEARYGFPQPIRRPSGHRLYALTLVPHLRRVAEALARGHRAGQVLRASETELSDLLGASPGVAVPAPARPSTPEPALMDCVLRFDSGGLRRGLLAEWARLGAAAFVTDRVAPLVREIGEGWAAGRLQVRHEHFASEVLLDVLGTLRQPFAERAAGPLVVLATLPGELHALGLQMAALLFAASGWRVVDLGTDCPVAQIAETARELRASAAAVSISAVSRPRAAQGLRELRAQLPPSCRLFAGGDGAPARSASAEVIRDLPALVAQLGVARA